MARESRPEADSRAAVAFGGADQTLVEATFVVRLDLPELVARIVARDCEDGRTRTPDPWALTWADPRLVRVVDADLDRLPAGVRVVAEVGRLQPSPPVVSALVRSGARLEFVADDVATARAWHSAFVEVIAGAVA